MGKQTLMVIGAGIFQLPAIETAKSMGLKVLAVDGNPAAPGKDLADYFEPVSIADIDRVVEKAGQLGDQELNKLAVERSEYQKLLDGSLPGWE